MTFSEQNSRVAVRLVWPRRVLFLVTVAVLIWGINGPPAFQHYHLLRTMLCAMYVLSALPSLLQLWLVFGNGVGGGAVDRRRIPGIPNWIRNLVHAEGRMWRRLAAVFATQIQTLRSGRARRD
jgi:hypothetical protein